MLETRAGDGSASLNETCLDTLCLWIWTKPKMWETLIEPKWLLTATVLYAALYVRALETCERHHRHLCSAKSQPVILRNLLYLQFCDIKEQTEHVDTLIHVTLLLKSSLVWAVCVHDGLCGEFCCCCFVFLLWKSQSHITLYIQEKAEQQSVCFQFCIVSHISLCFHFVNYFNQMSYCELLCKMFAL